jgi:enoyl-[acyl-carrier protein] reductase I
MPQIQKAALVLGVANQKSIAWACVQSLLERDFDHVFFTYQNERFKKSVDGMANQLFSLHQSIEEKKSLSHYACDVSNEDEVKRLFEEQIPDYLNTSKDRKITLDAVIHSIAYAPTDAMKSGTELSLLNTSREAYDISHQISAYSLVSVARHALPLLSSSSIDNYNVLYQERHPSITALTYLGSSRAVRNYNVMGPAKASLEAIVRGLALETSPPPHKIRVNAVSAGPVNTLAARGIKDFNEMRKESEARSFLKRSVTSKEVGNTVAFLAGPSASGITGQVIFCDGGYMCAG